MTGALAIPRAFLRIRYDGSQHPRTPRVAGLKTGANCQRFVYELLRHFGREIPEFRSAELWRDRKYTFAAQRPAPMDIVLFNRSADPWGAHLGLYLGDGNVIHLSKAIGYPAVWPIGEFAGHERYRTFIGAKRVRLQLQRSGKTS